MTQSPKHNPKLPLSFIISIDDNIFCISPLNAVNNAPRSQNHLSIQAPQVLIYKIKSVLSLPSITSEYAREGLVMDSVSYRRRSKILDFASLNDDLLIDLLCQIAKLDTFICPYLRLVHVDVEESHATVISSVSAIATKASATRIAHPQRRLLGFIARKGAVFVSVVARWC